MERTPTPELFARRILPGANELRGRIGSTNEKGEFIPEVGSYIYVYINGFFINEVFNSEVKNSLTSVMSDENGYWSIQDLSYFFSTLKYKDTVVVRAQTPYKELSLFSPPVIVGGSPTPFNLGKINDFGTYSHPEEGDTYIEGDLYGWQDQTWKPSSDPNDTPAFLRHLNTTINVYSNGHRIGEVLPNQIVGTNRVFLRNEAFIPGTLNLYVQDNLVELDITNINKSMFLEVFTLDETMLQKSDNFSQNTFELNPPIIEKGLVLKIKVYRNGLLLSNRAIDDYIIFNSNSEAKTKTILQLNNFHKLSSSEDKLVVEYFIYESAEQYQVDHFTGNGLEYFFELTKIPISPSNYDINSASRVKVYVNGVRLKDNQYPFSERTDVGDYYLNTYFDTDLNMQVATIYFNPTSPPPADQANVVVHYNVSTEALTNTFQYYVTTTTPTIKVDTSFIATGFNFIVFKNGLRLTEGIVHDYTVNYETRTITLNFTPQSTDSFIVDLVKSPQTILSVVSFLNSTEYFRKNKIIAKHNSYGQLVLESPFTLDLAPNNRDTHKLLFGDGYNIWPGKNDANLFRFYFNAETGHWRFSNTIVEKDQQGNYEKVIDLPFKKMEHISASSYCR